eukprot:139372_1
MSDSFTTRKCWIGCFLVIVIYIVGSHYLNPDCHELVSRKLAEHGYIVSNLSLYSACPDGQFENFIRRGDTRVYSCPFPHARPRKITVTCNAETRMLTVEANQCQVSNECELVARGFRRSHPTTSIDTNWAAHNTSLPQDSYLDLTCGRNDQTRTFHASCEPVITMAGGYSQWVFSDFEQCPTGSWTDLSDDMFSEVSLESSKSSVPSKTSVYPTLLAFALSCYFMIG